VDEHAVGALIQNNIAVRDLLGMDGFYGEKVAGPQRGEHTRSGDFQSQLAARLQNLYGHAVRALCPARYAHGIGYELFLLNLH
jgi:hypothetical protein